MYLELQGYELVSALWIVGLFRMDARFLAGVMLWPLLSPDLKSMPFFGLPEILTVAPPTIHVLGALPGPQKHATACKQGQKGHDSTYFEGP